MIKGSGIKSMSNQKLADGLHKPIIRKFKRRKGNILEAYLADLQLISKQKNDLGFYYVFLIFWYAWVASLKEKKKYYYCWCISKYLR